MAMVSSLTQLPTRAWSEVVTLFLTLIFGHKGKGRINS